jgi:hypothetical protein
MIFHEILAKLPRTKFFLNSRMPRTSIAPFGANNSVITPFYYGISNLSTIVSLIYNTLRPKPPIFFLAEVLEIFRRLDFPNRAVVESCYSLGNEFRHPRRTPVTVSAVGVTTVRVTIVLDPCKKPDLGFYLDVRRRQLPGGA